MRMKQIWLPFLGAALLACGLWGWPAQAGAAPDDANEQLLVEKKHFAECLAFVYSPALWISYNDSLYFQPKDQTQMQRIEAMKAARAQYSVFTNRELRHALAAKVIQQSGIDPAWQKKILLPYSTSVQNLTPTLERPLRTITQYRVVQVLGDGDALIQDEEASYFVMQFSGGTNGATGTNAFLIREGEKTLTTRLGGTRRYEAFTSVSLSQEETSILNRVAGASRREAAALAQELAGSNAQQEFELAKARATDSNPYLQYLIAKAYLEGKGTEKDEKLGLEWMNRAAKNGSGDASAYLESAKPKAR